ncbi:MAG: glycerophosphodiester phosphodiesterase family protein [Erythrobacter sp.]|jgi:glycerophosphoryl diester phosphodiesterase|nr:glycerophosphodiester phosphodiesterase family protein [Erythrobacter sp.]
MIKPRLLLATLLLGGTPVLAQDAETLIIAHRGASAERPEHTLAAYERAIDQGADYIEPDLVVTKDLVLVARHENELSGTTDVATREEFEDRRRDKIIDGQRVAGWFAEDFTLAELRTLRVKERIPSLRPANARFDGLYQVPTLAEIVKLLRAKEATMKGQRRVGIYPELKHPNFMLQDAGIDMVDLLLRDFRELGITPENPVFIQSFEIAPLQRLKQREGGFKLVQLVAPIGGPADEPAMRYAEMVTPTGLAEIAKYADAVGAHISLILKPDGSPTSLVADARAAGLAVHAWTVRPENEFLPPMLRTGTDPKGRGCGDTKLALLLEKAGVTGIFTDGELSHACAEAMPAK